MAKSEFDQDSICPPTSTRMCSFFHDRFFPPTPVVISSFPCVPPTNDEPDEHNVRCRESCRVRRATVAAARDRPSHRCRSRWTRWRRPWSPRLSPVPTLLYCLSGVCHQGRRLSLGCSLIRTVQRQPTNLSTSRPNRKILRYVLLLAWVDSLSFSFASRNAKHKSQRNYRLLTFTFTLSFIFTTLERFLPKKKEKKMLMHDTMTLSVAG